MEYAVAPMSLAHTFGNVTAFVQEYILGMYRPNFFKTVNVTSAISYKYFNINTNQDNLIKRSKPMLIIRPRINLMEDDVFLGNTMLTNRITDNYYDLDFGNLQDFYTDKKLGVSMKFLLNRIRMYFDVTMIFETQMEQINQGSYLKNRVRQDHPFFLTTSLESNIPSALVEIIAREAGIDVADKPEVLKHMNTQSMYPVTYKMKNSTGRDEFFRYYPTQLDTTFTGLTMDDGSKRGMANGSYPINFTISTEFFTSGLYYLFSKTREHIDAVDISIEAGDQKTLISIFTIPNLFDIQLPVGWIQYAAPMFKVSTDDRPDELELNTVFNEMLMHVLKHHLDNFIPISNFMNVIVMKDNVKLEPATDYAINYEEMKLIIKNTNRDSTYRLIILINSLYINSHVDGRDKER